MSKGITKADDYVCALSKELKQQAESELRETSASRNFALNALREWLESNARVSSVRLGKWPQADAGCFWQQICGQLRELHCFFFENLRVEVCRISAKTGF